MTKTLAFLFLIALTGFYSNAVQAQSNDTTLLVLDELQFDVADSYVKNDTAFIELFVINTDYANREFKMNNYASLIVDEQDDEHFFTEIRMNRVLIRLEDQTNYLHYMLTQDIPVSLQFKVANWTTERGHPQAVKIVFEDKQEAGRFRELKVYLPQKK